MSKLLSRCQPPNQPYLYPWSHNSSAAVDDLLDTLTIELDWPTLNDQMTAEQLREALKNLRAQQDALGKQLGELQQGLRDLGMEPGENFGKAQQEMQGAGEALGKGRLLPFEHSLAVLNDGTLSFFAPQSAEGRTAHAEEKR